MTRLRRALALAALLLSGAAHAGSPRLCEATRTTDAAHQGRRLQLAAAVRDELAAAGATLAIVARSGVDLARFGLRYSHAGVSLRDSPHTPWSVRQLYYACDEGRPRLFDQGLAGFLLAADDRAGAFVSLLLLPAPEAQALQAAALDEGRALQLLAARYSANAYAFGTRYQNCNQWLAELLAAAWGGPDAGATRAQAQAWLREAGYAPHAFQGHPLLFALSTFVPLVHRDDHPEDDLLAGRFRVSLPDSITTFVQQRVAGVRRVELCQDERHVVVRHDGPPLDDACEPGPGDRVIVFDR
ncbi:MAG: DUF2145 domain-containing protein [Rubrivivax sp.]